MTEQPQWLAMADMSALHEYVLARTGGSPGLRDAGLLESALARPFNRWSYEGVEDIRDLSATYAVALAQNHPFVDGNKRAVFLGMGLFLELNGWRLTADDADTTGTFWALAAGRMDEQSLATWVRDNSAAS